jgi:hypothetical protein
MKSASISELKNELNELPRAEILALCLRLLKYKKENKELASYLLFEAHNEAQFIKNIKEEVDELFLNINSSNLYLAKKTLRKILSVINKHIKYSSKKDTEIELLLYFCNKLKYSKIPFHKSTSLNNIYQRQIVKIKKTVATLHEDLQADYDYYLEDLMN